jgi:hypothetical protein
MPYKLGDEISFCWAGDRAVFLDARRDRYFCLGRATEAIFRKLCADEAPRPSDVSSLAALKVIDTSEGQGAPLKAVNHIKPARSGLEEPSRTQPLDAFLALEATFAIVSTRRRLRQRPLLDIIRRRRASKLRFRANDASATDAMLEWAQAFSVARRMVPIPSICLLDSLALLDLLTRRGLAADLVFGVKLNPFAAHCWVQAGDVVLNDTLESVQRHTEILVV